MASGHQISQYGVEESMCREKKGGQNPRAHGQRAKEAKEVWLGRKEEMWVTAVFQKARQNCVSGDRSTVTKSQASQAVEDFSRSARPDSMNDLCQIKLRGVVGADLGSWRVRGESSYMLFFQDTWPKK